MVKEESGFTLTEYVFDCPVLSLVTTMVTVEWAYAIPWKMGVSEERVYFSLIPVKLYVETIFPDTLLS